MSLSRELGSIMMQSMVIQMNDRQLQTLAQLQAFLDGTTAVDFAVAAEERYGFIGRTVRRFTYGRLKRAEKAVVLRFLERVSGYSRQQLTRLVKRGARSAPLLKRYRGSRTSFASLYTVAAVLLLAHTDSLHGTPSGPATKKLKSLTQAEQYLKPGICFQDLDALAASISDNDSAQRLNDARTRLFKSFSNRSISAA